MIAGASRRIDLSQHPCRTVCRASASRTLVTFAEGSKMNSISRRILVAALPLIAVGLASTARAQGNLPTGATLFQNVRIFDGKDTSLSAPSNVLIKGNIIERISTEPIAA